jgi:hypothetical protein
VKPQIDSAQEPIHVVRWGPELEAWELEQHFDEIIALGASAVGKLGLVMDMSNAGRTAALHRERGSIGLKRAYAAIGHQVIGVAHVIPEPLARSMMSVVYWLMPPPFPTHMVASVDEGVEWLSGKLGLPTSVTQKRAGRVG